jgi:hypothetical protein
VGKAIARLKIISPRLPSRRAIVISTLRFSAKEALGNIGELLSNPCLLSPGILIFITILCFDTLGDTLRDILEPKMPG